MLHPDDDRLARRDQAIADLRVLLDDERLAEELDRARPELGIRSARVGYLRYKPGTSCIAGVDLDVDGGPVTVCVRAHADSGADKVGKIVERAARHPAPAVGAPVPFGTRSVLAFIPHDRKLRATSRLGRGDDAALLARVLPAELLPDASITHLRYKPERRWVARVDGPEGPRAILKCFAAAEFAPAAEVARRLPGATSAPVVRRLGASDRYHAAAYPFLPGDPLSAVLRSGPADGLLRTTGAALAALHAGDPSRLPAGLADEDVAAVGAAATTLRDLLPHRTRRIERLALRLGGALHALPTTVRPRHGDFSADQVLVTGDRVTVVDLDRAAAGDPAADPSLFAATALRVAVSGALRPAAARSQAAALVDGYVAAGGTDPEARMPVWTAAWLLRLAAEPFRFRADGWAAQSEELLGLAEAVAP